MGASASIPNYAVGDAVKVFSQTAGCWSAGKVIALQGRDRVVVEYVVPDGSKRYKTLPPNDRARLRLLNPAAKRSSPAPTPSPAKARPGTTGGGGGSSKKSGKAGSSAKKGGSGSSRRGSKSNGKLLATGKAAPAAKPRRRRSADSKSSKSALRALKNVSAGSGGAGGNGKLIKRPFAAWGKPGCLEASVGRGNCPIILTAPHGGDTLCDQGGRDLLRRTGQGTTRKDTYTIEMLESIKNLLSAQGCTPSHVTMRVSRKCIDANRSPAGLSTRLPQCKGHPYNSADSGSKQIYEHYHRAIAERIEAAERQFGFALHIDVHAHCGKVEHAATGKEDVPGTIYLGTKQGRTTSSTMSGIPAMLADALRQLPELSVRVDTDRLDGGWTVQKHSGFDSSGKPRGTRACIQIELGPDCKTPAASEAFARGLIDSLNAVAAGRAGASSSSSSSGSPRASQGRKKKKSPERPSSRHATKLTDVAKKIKDKDKSGGAASGAAGARKTSGSSALAAALAASSSSSSRRNGSTLFASRLRRSASANAATKTDEKSSSPRQTLRKSLGPLRSAISAVD